MENEIWKECGESNKYFYYVSNMGRIKNITKVKKKEKILNGTPNQQGYLRIKIKNIAIPIHTLVVYNFIGSRPQGLQIDHIDRNNQNNQLDNLRYVTPKENSKNTKNFRNGKPRRNVENGKIKINCPCGSIISKSHKARHEKSQKHKKYLNSLL
jgi:hypothetical protein